MRRKNPSSLAEVALFATGTAVGIVVGTVIATWIVETMQANGSLASGKSPEPLPAVPGIVPPPGYVA